MLVTAIYDRVVRRRFGHMLLEVERRPDSA